ncbi:MAG: sigma-54-dependent Fis family transcriptional regulator, partial [Gemmatimonadetes bacterium]|nr:sigma-54-dependent Fis family transcriptional regulator [Gemmatimonadota bacterium]
VDDRPSNIKTLQMRLAAVGYDVVAATNGPDALGLAQEVDPDLVLLDVMMPGMDGYEVCRRLKQQQGEDFVPVIMVTARSETEAVVEGLEAGADEYVTKPFEPLELLARVKSMLRIRRMYRENHNLRQEIAQLGGFDQIAGNSPAMAAIYRMLPQVIERATTVLLTGETGTGKETLARCIHHNGPSRSGRFVAVNCGALSEGLLESELFGHRKGSFTGATEDRAGLFEAADGGTVLLDEIGDTSPGLQVKLLRVLQEGEVIRVGETEPRKTNARVIAATHRDLEAEVKEGRFRQDLYYRLSVFPIALPPLRQRREDIPVLADHFLQQRVTELGLSTSGFTPEAMDALSRFDWPGNVRELENEIQRALVMAPADGAIGVEMLSERLRPGSGATSRESTGTLREGIAAVEREMIAAAFVKFEGNKSRIAKHLSISRWTLQQKLQLYGIS